MIIILVSVKGMKVRTLIAAVAATTLSLTACSSNDDAESPTTDSHEHSHEDGHDDDHDDHEHEHDGHDHADATAQETSERRVRVAVSTDDGVTILNESLEEVASFDGTSQARVAEASDDRHVWVVDSHNGNVTAIDAGSYAEAHGDHFHYYVTDAKKLDITLDMEKPAHVVSNPEVDGTAIYNDATGIAQFITTEQLVHGEQGTEVTSSTAHHGVVVPMPDDHYLVTKAEEGEALPSTIELRHSASDVEDTFQCAGMHGEVSDGWNAAFGCLDSVLIVRDGEATTVAYPEGSGDVRVGTLHATDDFSTLVGNFGPTKLALIKGDEFSELEVGSEYGSFAVTPDNTIAVLGTDGKLRTFTADGEPVATIDVIAAWEKPEGHGGISPQISVGEFAGANTVWVTEPSANKVHAVDLFSETVKSVDLEGQPSSIASLNNN